MPELGLEITQPVAEALMNGLVTDSQGFGTVNTTPEALCVAADLFKRGANLPEIAFKGLTSKPYEAVSYWAAGLSKLERDGQMVWATLTNEDRAVSGYNGGDDADLVQLLYLIDEAQVAVVFIEQNANKVKVSWRAKAGFDVSKVAQQFDGGGHVPAAGAVIHGKMDEVREKVLTATKESLMKN
jgi:phosphoesterase RecJ-like protein